MAHMAQSGNIRGLWSLWGLADIALEKNSFWVSHKFHFNCWKDFSIFNFFFGFWFFRNRWSSIISQSCDSSRAALKRWWGSGQFIYGFSLLHLSSCKRGKLVYEAHWNFMDYSPWFRVAWLTCRVCCFIPCIFIHKTCKSKLLVQQKW